MTGDDLIRAPLFATLPMYDWPETTAGWDALWRLVRAELSKAGIEAAPELRRDSDPWGMWRDPALILGQTCGWPYVSALRGDVVPLARFDFGLETARPGDYCSVFIAPPGMPLRHGSPSELAPLLEDPATVAAVNGTDSQSGFRVWGECLDASFDMPPERLLVTGSHRASIRAIAEGKATLASIDAVTWQIALAHEPAAREVAVVARSGDVPGLPLIIAAGLAEHRETVLAALENALAVLPREIRDLLGLKGIVPAVDADYDVVLSRPYGNVRLAGRTA